jgi:2-iminobutanoate/2-iminopropanoate deaminase
MSNDLRLVIVPAGVPDDEDWRLFEPGSDLPTPVRRFGIELARGTRRPLWSSSMSQTRIAFHMIAGGPTPVAPFSHATEADGFVFVTGQMPDSPGTPGVLPEGIEAQTANVMANLRTVLAGLGLDFGDVVVARAYLTRFREDYAAFNAAYQGYFEPGRLPARTCVGVTGLAYDALVEIDFVALRRGGATR